MTANYIAVTMIRTVNRGFRFETDEAIRKEHISDKDHTEVQCSYPHPLTLLQFRDEDREQFQQVTKKQEMLTKQSAEK